MNGTFHNKHVWLMIELEPKLESKWIVIRIGIAISAILFDL